MKVTSTAIEGLLRDAGEIDEGTRVASLETEPVERAGLLGRIRRIRLGYHPPHGRGPRSVIVKSSLIESEDGRAFGAAESQFYRHRIAELCSLTVPRAYHCELDEETGESNLVLEDLGDGGFI